MTHNSRVILIGLIAAWLAGYFIRVAVELIPRFRDVSTLLSVLVIFLILRVLVGKVD